MNTYQLLNELIYPALYEHLDEVFPEFGFIKTENGYRSSTGLKIDQSQGDKGKVYIYHNNISTFIDYTRGNISIWNYIQLRDNISNQDTLLLLSSLAKVSLPNFHEISEEFEEKVTHEKILEAANNFFIDCLSAKDQPIASTPAAQQVRAYIEKERKYTFADLRLPSQNRAHSQDFKGRMELGFAPNSSIVFEYLIKTNLFTEEQVYTALKFPSGAGSSHVLSIPFRNPYGHILGFIFRTINIDNTNNKSKSSNTNKIGKYLYSAGLKKDDTFFNLSARKRKKDLVIVEGILDALLATSRNVEDVVALGGTSLNLKQLDQAIKLGTEKITLCLDNDQAGEIATERAIAIISTQTSIKCFVAMVPSAYKDVDGLIIAEGVDSFLKIIAEAKPAYIYLFDKHRARLPKTKLDWKTLDKLLEKAILIAANIKEPIERDLFEHYVLQETSGLGITKESLKSTVETIRFDHEKEATNKKLSAVLSEASKNLTQISATDLIPSLEQKIAELKYSSNAHNYSKLLQITTEEIIRTKLHTQPESLHSGFLFREPNGHTGYDELMIPAGALSVIAARTSHGKTAVLMNLALNIALAHPEKSVHFFSLEEDLEAILLKLLNIYINQDLKQGVSNLKYIRNYFKTSGNTYHNADFLRLKTEFFEQLIYTGRLRVHYAGSDTDELVSMITYLKEKSNPGAILIDYIQLLNLKQSYQTRQLELQSICNKLLKDIAVPTGLPIVLGAQFNREVFEEGMLDSTKIREAGDIEQTANLVIGLWNRGFTNSAKHKNKKGEVAIHNPTELYLEVLKYRDGQSGLLTELDFNGNTGKISNKNEPEFRKY